jgi:hypothetical protein
MSMISEEKGIHVGNKYLQIQGFVDKDVLAHNLFFGMETLNFIKFYDGRGIHNLKYFSSFKYSRSIICLSRNGTT